MTTSITTFAFEFEPRMVATAALFGIRPSNSEVRLDEIGLSAEFGRWSIRVPLADIADARVTGPYRWWRVAGPAHLSLADRGVTFATTTRHGVCLDLRVPLPAIEPFGLLRHPSVTLTVADPHRFVEALGERGVPTSAVTDGGIEPGRGSWVGAAAALVEFHTRRGSVRVVPRVVDDVHPPPALDSPSRDGQDIDEGVGPAFHRAYEVRIAHPRLDAHAVMSAVAADPNVVVPQDLSPFVKQRGADGTMAVGDRFQVDTPGPWRANVEVTKLTPTSIRFATLDGHMEAGQIRFGARDDDGGLVFRIESWARSADRVFDVLYDVARIGRTLQGETWVRTCEAVAVAAGGEQDGPVTLLDERADSEPD